MLHSTKVISHQSVFLSQFLEFFELLPKFIPHFPQNLINIQLIFNILLFLF